LLQLATKEFEVFITTDRNLTFQQNLSSLPITVIVLRSKTNRLAELKPLVTELQEVSKLRSRAKSTWLAQTSFSARRDSQGRTGLSFPAEFAEGAGP
jgi:hypothetical protein